MNSVCLAHQQSATNNQQRPGLTLIEVLVVFAVVAVLLGILLPAVTKAQAVARACACSGNLRQIAVAWDLYLDDHEGRFYRGLQHHFDFGGWQGLGPYAVRRPLNRYLDLPESIPDGAGAKVFRCPADAGCGDYDGKAYAFFGNSFQANILLAGPTQIAAADWVPQPARTIHAEVNKYLSELKMDDVSQPAKVILAGDHNWTTQWEPMNSRHCGRAWHGRVHTYNLSFLDGHIGPARIGKALYVTDRYHVIPFKEALSLAADLQKELPCPCGR